MSVYAMHIWEYHYDWDIFNKDQISHWISTLCRRIMIYDEYMNFYVLSDHVEEMEGKWMENYYFIGNFLWIYVCKDLKIKFLKFWEIEKFQLIF